MAAPEQQKEYRRLSGVLQAIGLRYRKELPIDSKYLVMNVADGAVTVKAYDDHGKRIGMVPNESTSTEFRNALQKTFRYAVSGAPDGVVTIL